MKRLLFPLFAFLFALTATAQNWQPFREGRTYHFTQSGAVDSLFNFRVTAGPLMAGDSAWEFNPMAMRDFLIPQSAWCNAVKPIAKPITDNQFGHWLVKRAGGVYEFKTDSAGHFELRTQAAVGQSWNFGAGIQATLLSRGMQPLSLVLSDSVQTIRLSTSDTLVISKQFGLLQTPAFMAYADTTFAARQLRFFSLPEQGIGTAPISFMSVYDFQPGDKFQRYWEKHFMLGIPGPTHGWEQDSIIARTVFGPDSIRYTLMRESFETLPWPTPGTLYTPPTVITEAYYRGGYVEHGSTLLSQGVEVDTSVNASHYAAYPIHRSHFNQRFLMKVDKLMNSCPGFIGFNIDADYSPSFAQGLGCVSDSGSSMGEPQFKILTAYVKGSETYGIWMNLSLLASPEELSNSSVSVFPNPVNKELTVRLPASISANALVKLHDALGRVIWQGPAAQELGISLDDQPAGVYLLTVTSANAAWHCKVLKE